MQPSPDTPTFNRHDTLSRLQDGGSLSTVQAEALLQSCREGDADLQAVADELRARQVGDSVSIQPRVSLFLTNICELKPALYRYPRQVSDNNAYQLTLDQIDATLEMARIQGIHHLHVEGGFYSGLQLPGLEAPTLLKTFRKLLGYIADRYPEMVVSGFSPDKIDFFSVVSDKSPGYLLEFLKDFGLRELGTGYCGLLSDAVRHPISPKLISSKDWLDIAAMAARLKLSLALGMPYGHLETLKDRAEHLARMRRFAGQHPHASLRFVPQPLPQAVLSPALASITPAPPAERMATLALCRLMLGGALTRLQTQWLPDAPEEAQEGLLWGANDFGPTDAMAELEFLAGGTPTARLSATEAKALVEATGRVAAL